MGTTLRDGITRLMAERETPAVARLHVRAALDALETALGELDALSITGEQELAQKVRIEGDESVWVVFGEWEDGTLDVIREQGSFPRDVLVGWARGESLAEYWAGIESHPPKLELKHGGR